MSWDVFVIHVAVAVIINEEKKILIAQRPAHKYAGGLWEFPGGKVEEHETILQALRREIHEEIGLEILSAQPWLEIPHDYIDRKVLLDVWVVNQFIGEAKGREGQAIRWVFPVELEHFSFPAGNQTLIEKLLAGDW
jgi:8-oxo-dGTP diphosphatase